MPVLHFDASETNFIAQGKTDRGELCSRKHEVRVVVFVNISSFSLDYVFFFFFYKLDS